MTATGCGVEALGHGENGLDPRIDTGLAVTGRGLLTATGRAVSERVPLPAVEIGVTARGHTLSRVAGDYLAPLPARGLRSQDGWPDEKHRRGAEAVASQPPAVSEAPVAVTPVAGGAALTVLPSVVQDLARFF